MVKQIGIGGWLLITFCTIGAIAHVYLLSYL